MRGVEPALLDTSSPVVGRRYAATGMNLARLFCCGLPCTSLHPVNCTAALVASIITLLGGEAAHPPATAAVPHQRPLLTVHLALCAASRRFMHGPHNAYELNFTCRRSFLCSWRTGRSPAWHSARWSPSRSLVRQHDPASRPAVHRERGPFYFHPPSPAAALMSIALQGRPLCSWATSQAAF